MKNFKIDLRGLSTETRQEIYNQIRRIAPNSEHFSGDIDRPVYFRVDNAQRVGWCTSFTNADYYQPDAPWISFGQLLEIKPKPQHANRPFTIDNIPAIQKPCISHLEYLGYRSYPGEFIGSTYLKTYSDGDYSTSRNLGMGKHLSIKEFFELTPEDCRV